MFEDPDWRSFFWSSLPSGQPQEDDDDDTLPLAKALVSALCVRQFTFCDIICHFIIENV